MGIPEDAHGHSQDHSRTPKGPHKVPCGAPKARGPGISRRSGIPEDRQGSSSEALGGDVDALKNIKKTLFFFVFPAMELLEMAPEKVAGGPGGPWRRP